MKIEQLIHIMMLIVEQNDDVDDTDNNGIDCRSFLYLRIFLYLNVTQVGTSSH